MKRSICSAAVVTAALATGVLAGCGGGGDNAGTTAVKPVTLRIGTDDSPGKPSANEIQEFSRRAAALSGGKIKITPVWHAAGDGPNWDQRNGRLVESGKIDMGLIPSRAWDVDGVTSLRALNDPFLITSDKLVDQVISGPLAGQLMSGLGQVGVAGIALFPEGLRHPFGYDKPLLGPSDYASKRIRMATSITTEELFTALNAQVTDDDTDPDTQAGVESSYLQDPGGVATGNVTFYPKVNVLVINKKVLAGLDKAQVAVLNRAAEQTRNWAINMLPSDVQAAQGFCKSGKRVALASPAQLAALEDTAQPVTARLESDPQTKSLIGAIAQLKQSMGQQATAAACDGRAATGGGAEPATAIDGTYRNVVTDADLHRFGVTDQGDIDENHGVMTWTFKNGHYCWKQKAPNPVANPSECSTYEVSGNRLQLDFPSGPPDVYTFKKTANGDLAFTLVSTDPEAKGIVEASIANPWKRIGVAK